MTFITVTVMCRMIKLRAGGQSGMENVAGNYGSPEGSSIAIDDFSNFHSVLYISILSYYSADCFHSHQCGPLRMRYAGVNVNKPVCYT